MSQDYCFFFSVPIPAFIDTESQITAVSESFYKYLSLYLSNSVVIGNDWMLMNGVINYENSSLVVSGHDVSK